MPSRAIDQYCGAAGRMWPSWATPSNRIRSPLPQRPMLKSDPQARRDDAPPRSRAAPARLRPAPGLAGAARVSRGRQIRTGELEPPSPDGPALGRARRLPSHDPRASAPSQTRAARPVRDLVSGLSARAKYGIAPRRAGVGVRSPIERRSRRRDRGPFHNGAPYARVERGVGGGGGACSSRAQLTISDCNTCEVSCCPLFSPDHATSSESMGSHTATFTPDTRRIAPVARGLHQISRNSLIYSSTPRPARSPRQMSRRVPSGARTDRSIRDSVRGASRRENEVI